MTDAMTLAVGHMPDGHIVVGYIAHLKVLDNEGTSYYATRIHGLSDMEMLGMATDMANSFADVLRTSKEAPGEQS